jgi:hypothetical protein
MERPIRDLIVGLEQRGVQFDVDGRRLVVLGMNRLEPTEFIVVSQRREDIRQEILRRRVPNYFAGKTGTDLVRAAELVLAGA